MLSAFTSGRGYSADAQYSARAWLVHKTGVTKGTAASHTAWMRRALEHPAVFAALAAGDVSESVARILCQWTDKVPENRRDDADTILVAAVNLLSGPGGLASFLRRRQLGVRLSGPSLPLDIGYSETIPAGIRNAVILRDRHCRFPGCHQPASVCQVHHVKHKKHGGETSTTDCVLLCRFHHLIVIHKWDWSLVLNRDGTTTAWNKDKTKVLHSHGPPVRPG
jgi:hypothetical protein